jgi:hypothetical protein
LPGETTSFQSNVRRAQNARHEWLYQVGSGLRVLKPRVWLRTLLTEKTLAVAHPIEISSKLIQSLSPPDQVMDIIQFPTKLVGNHFAKALQYRLKASAFARKMEASTDDLTFIANMSDALSMIQLAENEEWLANSG